MDIEIIENILKGNVDSFSELIEKYEKMIYNLAYRILNNYSDAEDVTQEVFLKIYKNIEKCKGKQSIKTWVYTITYNAIRKNKVKNNISLDKNLDYDYSVYSFELPSDEPTPEAYLLNKESIKDIENAISKLSENNKALIFLRDIKGLSYNEISEVMDMNIGTVKSRLNRARNSLKNILNL